MVIRDSIHSWLSRTFGPKLKHSFALESPDNNFVDMKLSHLSLAMEVVCAFRNSCFSSSYVR